MDQPSFVYVTEDGFHALAEELSRGAWGTVDITGLLNSEGVAAKPLCTAPAIAYFKLELVTALDALGAARSSTYNVKDLDRTWDNLQRQLNLALATAATDPDAGKREAAARLQKLLLHGGGTGQTRFKYHKEVDFGRKQVATAAKGEAAGDVALLGLGATVTAIGAATDALAAAISHGETDERPSEQVRSAKSACAEACAWVAAGLARLAKRGEAGADRDTAAKLLETLTTLAGRYPAPAKDRKGTDTTDDAAPAAQTGGAIT